MLAHKNSSGFTLVELAITLAILAILTTLGLPSFLGMLESGRIKAAASGFAMGLQRARAEAISRGQPVIFVPDGSGWRLEQAEPDGSGGTQRVVIESKSSAESGGAQIANSASTEVGFNNLGRTTAPVIFNFSGPSGCGGEPRCLRVRVFTGGQVRLCDPAVTDTTDTRSCGS